MEGDAVKPHEGQKIEKWLHLVSLKCSKPFIALLIFHFKCKPRGLWFTITANTKSMAFN